MQRWMALALLLLTPLAGTGRTHAQPFDLTGLWVDDTGTGAVYRLRQIERSFYWTVDGTAVGSSANFFAGAIDGDVIEGSWLDLPGSPALGGGTLTLRVNSNNHLVKVGESPCCYAAREWFRQESAPVGPPLVTPPPPPPVSTRGIDWSYQPNAEHRNQIGQRFTYTCPPGGPTSGRLWGTDEYTDDSSLCLAAVHAGVITLAGGGTVTIEVMPGRSSYSGSTRNGVTSSNWDSWPAGFRFVR